MSFEIGRTRDEQSTLCSRARDKYEKNQNLKMKLRPTVNIQSFKGSN
jgi:hypothetical protein